MKKWAAQFEYEIEQDDNLIYKLYQLISDSLGVLCVNMLKIYN